MGTPTSQLTEGGLCRLSLGCVAGERGVGALCVKKSFMAPRTGNSPAFQAVEKVVGIAHPDLAYRLSCVPCLRKKAGWGIPFCSRAARVTPGSIKLSSLACAVLL